MAFKMKVSQEAMKGLEPVPPGIYDVVLIQFKPKKSKAGDSINLNAQAKVLGHPELGENRYIFATLNQGIQAFWQDFVHSFGIEMEDQLADEPSFPGIWDGDPNKFKEDDPSTWVYKGPLIGQSAKWEVGVKDYDGNPTQEIIKFICKVNKCAERFPKIRHSKDMRRKG